MSINFEDPFAGTPKAATRRELGIDNSSPLEKARRGIIFLENGFFGMKDTDGFILYPAKYAYIGKCKNHVLFLEPSGNYCKMSPCCTESGYMRKEERPYVENGRVGYKADGRIIIPAEYDYISPIFSGNAVFLVVKNGREYYINDRNKEVLTRIRSFEGEGINDSSPFWLRTNSFDYFTVMSHVGHEDENNPNVVQISGEWVELERYCKEEIMEMLVNPEDDLRFTEDDLRLLCDDFSYEYSFYLASASGRNPLSQCMDQLERMGVFDNSWHFITKIWLAPGENVTAKELRSFEKRLCNHNVIGKPLFSVGHSNSLSEGEVKVLFITHYNERCFPAPFEFEWSDKCRKLPIYELQKHVPELRETISEEVMPQYTEQVFYDQIYDCIEELNYFEGNDWHVTEDALDYFLAQGSRINKALFNFCSNAREAFRGKEFRKAEYYLHAALWAIDKESDFNYTFNSDSVIGLVRQLKEEDIDGRLSEVVDPLLAKLQTLGAKTAQELKEERESNCDYWKELQYLKR